MCAHVRVCACARVRVCVCVCVCVCADLVPCREGLEVGSRWSKSWNSHQQGGLGEGLEDGPPGSGLEQGAPSVPCSTGTTTIIGSDYERLTFHCIFYFSRLV